VISAQVAPTPKHVAYTDRPTMKEREKRPLQQAICLDCESEIPSWHPVAPYAGLCLTCQHRVALAPFVPHET
jgi:RNA polymerase-binding transcription factor DksA